MHRLAPPNELAELQGLTSKPAVRSILFSAENYAFSKDSKMPKPAHLIVGGDLPSIDIYQMDLNEGVLKLWVCSPLAEKD